MRVYIAQFIRLYQRTLSPDHGWFQALFPHGFCRYYPTCSEYTRLSILKFGVVYGVLLGLSRVLRCNPFIQPQIDRIPR